jgi:hypothetical protein
MKMEAPKTIKRNPSKTKPQQSDRKTMRGENNNDKRRVQQIIIMEKSSGENNNLKLRIDMDVEIYRKQ